VVFNSLSRSLVVVILLVRRRYCSFNLVVVKGWKVGNCFIVSVGSWGSKFVVVLRQVARAPMKSNLGLHLWIWGQLRPPFVFKALVRLRFELRRVLGCNWDCVFTFTRSCHLVGLDSSGLRGSQCCSTNFAVLILGVCFHS